MPIYFNMYFAMKLAVNASDKSLYIKKQFQRVKCLDLNKNMNTLGFAMTLSCRLVDDF